MNKFDAQILVRLPVWMMEWVVDCADHQSCSIPEWIRRAIVEKIERDFNVNFKNHC